jgi:hypothetical protein
MCPNLDGYGVMTVLSSEEKVTITDNKRNIVNINVLFRVAVRSY